MQTVELAEGMGRFSVGKKAWTFCGEPGATAAVVWVPGVDSGWLRRMRAAVAPRLCAQGIVSLELNEPDWSHPIRTMENLQTGLEFLRQEGVESVALAGHALGATVAMWAGVECDRVRSVVALSPAAIGIGAARGLGPRCSLLVVHGTEDRVLSPENAREMYDAAREPRQMVLLRGAGHEFDGHEAELGLLLRGWLAGELAAARPAQQQHHAGQRRPWAAMAS